MKSNQNTPSYEKHGAQVREHGIHGGASGRREQIVEAARDLFLEAGTEGVTMRKVGTRVGISAPAIYRHFRDKDDLLNAVVAEGRRLLASSLFQALDGSTPLDRLRLSGERYLDFAFESPHYYKVFFMSWDRLSTDVHGRDDERPVEPGALPPAMQFLFDRVGECIGAGVLPADVDPFEMVMLLWSQCHGLAAIWVAGNAQEQMSLEQYRALCHNVIRRVLDGLKV